MNLFVRANEDTIAEAVSKNTANIQILADEIAKLGYSPKGEYSAIAEYNYNDVVFYNNKLYAMIADGATVAGVLPTDTTKWQAITGDIRGQQGAQGEQGEQGEAGQDGTDGADGLNALVCKAIQTGGSEPPAVSSTRNLSFEAFNRAPVVGETFEMYVVLTNGDVYICGYRVSSIISEVAVCTCFQTPIRLNGQNGADGATGKIALVYDRVFAPTFDPTQQTQLVNVTLPFANFNRTPELNEDFVGILRGANSIDYIAQCEVQDIYGTNVIALVLNDINRITGENGTDGVDALQMTYAKTVTAVPQPTDVVTVPEAAFNRTPRVNDVFTMIADYTTAGRSFICICRADYKSGDWNCTVLSVVETTGQAGQGAKLYEHNIHFLYETGSGTNAKSWNVVFRLINRTAAQILSLSDLAQILYTNGFTGEEKTQIATGTYKDYQTYYILNSICSPTGAYVQAKGTNAASGSAIPAVNIVGTALWNSDIVIEL